MKAQKIIDNYCSLYGTIAPKVDLGEKQYFVTISPNGSNVLSIHKPSKLLGQIVGSAMKRGTVLYVQNNWVTPITWENWKSIWNKLFTQKARKTAPVPNVLRPYKSEIFETMQQKSSPKKPPKHGFERTYVANKSMNLLGTSTIQHNAIS